jgi:hypothetical protein
VPLIIAQPFEGSIGLCSYTADHGHGRSHQTESAEGSCRAAGRQPHAAAREAATIRIRARRESRPQGRAWCREIMRLTKIIAGRDSWAGPSKTVREAGKVPWMNLPQLEDRGAAIVAESNRSMATRPRPN